ncbi:hypothetical protein HN446_05315 [bacterium]|jgi:hypothetical protein|nr:hypothetical protein [bacterium]
MNKKCLIFMLSLLLCGQVESASALKRLARVGGKVGFAVLFCGYIKASCTSREDEEQPFIGPIPIKLEEGEFFDERFSELGSWAQKTVGVPFGKRLPIVVGKTRKTWSIATCKKDKIVLDKRILLRPAFYQRIVLLHEAVHIVQRYRFNDINLNLYKHEEEEADCVAAKASGCWYCVKKYSDKKRSADSRPYEIGHYRYNYATRERLLKIESSLFSKGLVCEEHKKHKPFVIKIRLKGL